MGVLCQCVTVPSPLRRSIRLASAAPLDFVDACEGSIGWLRSAICPACAYKLPEIGRHKIAYGEALTREAPLIVKPAL